MDEELAGLGKTRERVRKSLSKWVASPLGVPFRSEDDRLASPALQEVTPTITDRVQW